MKTYQRPAVSAIVRLLDEKPERLIVVTGVRQTGKTIVALQALEQVDRPCRYLAADAPRNSDAFSDGMGNSTVAASEDLLPSVGKKDAGWIIRKWKEARIEAESSQRGFVMVFDEIQKIPNWPETVRSLWDEDRRDGRPLHVILVCPLLPPEEEDLSESLEERLETVRLTHWSFAEMSEAFGFDLSSYIYFGGYPGAAGMIREQDTWRSYVYDSLVQAKIGWGIFKTHRVKKPALLEKLFRISASYSGQILSYNKMLGRLRDAGNTTTLRRYLELLESEGLVAGLPKYIGTVHRRRAPSPKLNVLNTALMSVCSGYTFEEAEADRSFWKQMIKSTVGAHLFNTGMPEVRLYYWKDGNHQVDFVLELGGKLVAFEVGAGADIPGVTGLKEFEKRFNSVCSELVGDGGMPLEEFLSVPASDWF